ncbi:hypothetical protein NIES592_08225 [Fischerella major NIES-592]|uniref:Uncharacterized protein n=1 Tax=Fischerella major NIES-592 TaxID=210994 RepID=A0A1U7H1K5_9CYAN|nr:hypothetical protein [Fischerella major]OKH14854.1 hypothetical protein NIES592_08225 [Fischerella major NIES-592]
MPIWRSWTPPKLTITTATYRWTAPYAYDVHERQGNRWTDRALSGSNLPAVFTANYQNTHNLNLAFTATANYLNQIFLQEVPVSSGRLKASQSMMLS